MNCIIAQEIIYIMKKISLILIVLSTVYIGSISTGCSDKPVATPTPIDTTNTGDTSGNAVIDNQINIGIKLYKLVTSKEGATGAYSVSTSKTTIAVDGIDSKNGPANFDIKFTGTNKGTFTMAGGNLEFACGRGELNTVYREEFGATGSIFTVDITEYGPVGGTIKGTFSGTVKNLKTGQSVDVTLGVFSVTRGVDQ
jgi:hypothetical protein|tara:strand:- start:4048 stop:4638 length:591 start_codon:yes stop_codon:yes gene_type:complete